MMTFCFLAFVHSGCEGLGEVFKVFIAHAALGFDHRYCPNGPFAVRRVALRPAKPHGCSRHRDADNENKEFVHIRVVWWFCCLLFLASQELQKSPEELEKS